MERSGAHEYYKCLLGRMVGVASLELRIPISSFGAMSLKRPDLHCGIDPDECYYVQHERQVGARSDIDLLTDPPPDLVIDIELPRHELNRQTVFASIGVPELWWCDGERLNMLGLKGRDYVPLDRSLAFPLFTPAIIERFVQLARDSSQHAAIVAFRDWIRAAI